MNECLFPSSNYIIFHVSGFLPKKPPCGVLGPLSDASYSKLVSGFFPETA